MKKRLSEGVLRKTEWFKEYLEDAPSSAEEALKFALTEPLFEIRKSKDTGKILFAISPKSDPDFWMDGLETRELAMGVCQALGWDYVNAW